MKKIVLFLSMLILSFFNLFAADSITFDELYKSVRLNDSPLLKIGSVSKGALDGYNLPPVPNVPDPICIQNCGGGDSGNQGQDGNNEPFIPSFGQDPLDLEKIFAGAVCVNDVTYGEKCFNEKGKDIVQRASRLALKKIIREFIVYNLKLRFPYYMNKALQVEAIFKLEQKSREAAVNQIHYDIAKLTPMSWMTPQEKERNIKIIKNDEAALKVFVENARKEEMSRINWKSAGDNTYVFSPVPGGAYDQLGKALIGKQWYFNQ